MTIPDEIRQYWDTDAATYDGCSDRCPGKVENAAWERLLSDLLPAPATVLDVAPAAHRQPGGGQLDHSRAVVGGLKPRQLRQCLLIEVAGQALVGIAPPLRAHHPAAALAVGA